MATLVTAIIRPHALDQVKAALIENGVSGITITEVKGHGRQGGHTETYRGAEYTVDLLPKVKVEVVVSDAAAPSVVGVVAEAAQSGKIGDGKIWTTTVGSLQRIRTGELGEDAI
jgi:nitrogen regulatory protein P-II 1